MKAFELIQGRLPGFKEQMVSIGEHDVAVNQILEGVLKQTLHRALCADRHVNRRAHLSMAHSDRGGAAPLKSLMNSKHKWGLVNLRALGCRFKCFFCFLLKQSFLW